jgi:hypothetical protein
VQGAEFQYAHSIIRQYGFFVIQLSLTALLFATNPVLYQNFIRAFAAARLAMAALSGYAFATSSISFMHFFPVFVWEIGMAILLFVLAPNQKNTLSREAERRALSGANPVSVFGIVLAPKWQYLALQWLCAIAGGLWILWALGSTVFWEIGAANISSEKAVEMNLINAMRLNNIVRCEQGVMLFGIGLLTLMTAQHPIYHRQMLLFIMAQQIINASNAALELAFGAILPPQFLTVFSVQVITLILFYVLYPKVQPSIVSSSDISSSSNATTFLQR